MLIRNAEIYGHGRGDVRLAHGRVAMIGALAPLPDEPVMDARGGALLPGLHDHHIHLAALAARQDSTPCGPPDVTNEADLAARLAAPGSGWLRGIGYHESVAGMLDRALLDHMAPNRPVRIQHRSGRMWFLNSAALDLLLAGTPPPPGLERDTGRLFDADIWLRAALGGTPPDFASVSAELTRMGVTGITDMSPANDPAIAAHFAAQQARGHLMQRTMLAGTLALADMTTSEMLILGPGKLHLHEADLPDYDATVAFVAATHAQKRVVAVHCVTETELVFALAAIAEAGARAGDRIEHASIAPDGLIAEIARLGLAVISQPNFIAERGDQYLAAVDPDAIPLLYRLAAFPAHGVTLAGGSDAPFGQPDPWAAMRAAVSRRTAAGSIIGAEEALQPEAALALFLADPVNPDRQRRVEPGAPADLCLLDRPWVEARTRLSAGDVRATFIDGDLVDQAP